MRLLSILLVLFSTQMIMAQSKYKGSAAEPGGYDIGDIATDFALKNVDGTMVSMADYPKSKGFVIVFTCNHCPYSIMYEDRLIALDAQIKPMGYQLIAINPNDPEIYEGDSYELMKVRAKEKGFTFPYLYDDGQKVFPKYGATKTPHVYFLDAERVVQYIGAIDDNAQDTEDVSEPFLLNAITAHSEGRLIYPSLTKAIGCSIRVLEKE